VVQRDAGLPQVGQGRVDASVEHGDHVEDDALHVDDAAAHLVLRRRLVAADLVRPPGALRMREGEDGSMMRERTDR